LQLRLLLKDDMMDASQNIEKMADITSDLARRWATHRVDAITRYGRIIADYGRGQTGERSALQALAKLAVEEAVRYPGEAITLAADYAKAWLDIAGVKVDIPLTSKHAQAGKRSDDIFLRGALGTIVTHDLVIENPQDRSVDVTLSATPFDGAVGNLVKATLKCAPQQFSLAAHSEQLVILSIKLDKAKFKRGETYHADVAVSGAQDMLLHVQLHIDGAD
jgi:hypothetical protein